MNSRISKLRSALNSAKACRDLIKGNIDKSKLEIKRLSRDEKDCFRAIVVLEYMIERKYDSVLQAFEGTISAGLKELFNDGYDFRLQTDRSGTNCVCNFEISTDKCPYYQDIKMTQGRSVQEIIGCLNRLVICKLDNRIMKVLVLDEPFGGLKPFRAEKAAEFLQKICREFNMQVIIVTQIQEMCDYADNSIDLSVKEKKVTVKL